ncbi:Fur family transcriptional regulator [Actinoplanes sp. CA-131856]
MSRVGVSVVTADDLLAALVGAGVRRTQASRAIAEILIVADCLTAAEVHRGLEAQDVRIDLTTVHRVLGRLAAAGAVRAVPREGSVGYRLASRARHFLVCRRCGRTAPLTEPASAALLADAADAGFGLETIAVSAQCRECRPLSRPTPGQA